MVEAPPFEDVACLPPRVNKTRSLASLGMTERKFFQPAEAFAEAETRYFSSAAGHSLCHPLPRLPGTQRPTDVLRCLLLADSLEHSCLYLRSFCD